MGFLILGREHERVQNKLHKLRDEIEDFGSVAFPENIEVYEAGVKRRLLERRNDIWAGVRKNTEYRLLDFNLFVSDPKVKIIRAWFENIEDLETFSKVLVSAKELGKDVLVFCHSMHKENLTDTMALMKDEGWLRFKKYDTGCPYVISFGGLHRMTASVEDKNEVVVSCNKADDSDIMASFAKMRTTEDD